jgi:hypothetical protein
VSKIYETHLTATMALTADELALEQSAREMHGVMLAAREHAMDVDDMRLAIAHASEAAAAYDASKSLVRA